MARKYVLMFVRIVTYAGLWLASNVRATDGYASLHEPFHFAAHAHTPIEFSEAIEKCSKTAGARTIPTFRKLLKSLTLYLVQNGLIESVELSQKTAEGFIKYLNDTDRPGFKNRLRLIRVYDDAHRPVGVIIIEVHNRTHTVILFFAYHEHLSAFKEHYKNALKSYVQDRKLKSVIINKQTINLLPGDLVEKQLSDAGNAFYATELESIQKNSIFHKAQQICKDIWRGIKNLFSQ